MKKKIATCTLVLVLLNYCAYNQTIHSFKDKPLNWKGQKCVYTLQDNPNKSTGNNDEKVGMVISNEITWEYVTTADKLPFLDFSENPYITVKVLAPKNGKVLVKLEDYGNSAISQKVEQSIKASGEWQTLYFDFTGVPKEKFNRISLFFDFSSTRNDDKWYFGDVVQCTKPKR